MRIATFALLICLTLLVGCDPQPGKLRVPDSFVELSEAQARPYQARAVSADGVVAALRQQANPKSGTLAFWTQAITDKMTKDKGYQLVSSEPLTSRTGRTGRKLHLTRTIRGVDFTYLMAIYVDGDRVRIAEAGGRTKHVQPLIQELGESLGSL